MDRGTEKIVMINELFASLNVKMNAIKFVFRMSRRDRHPRTVKKA